MMDKELHCSELGVEDCDLVARGETAGAIVREIVQHLRQEHDLDLPGADEILAEDMDMETLSEQQPAVYLIVKRLRQELEIQPAEEPIEPGPTIGRVKTA